MRIGDHVRVTVPPFGEDTDTGVIIEEGAGRYDWRIRWDPQSKCFEQGYCPFKESELEVIK